MAGNVDLNDVALLQGKCIAVEGFVLTVLVDWMELEEVDRGLEWLRRSLADERIEKHLAAARKGNEIQMSSDDLAQALESFKVGYAAATEGMIDALVEARDRKRGLPGS